MELKKLFNTLITKWRKPRGRKLKSREYKDKEFLVRTSNTWEIFTLRDVVSIESWLRQFVCENELYVDIRPVEIHKYAREVLISDYEYRLMLSSIQENIEQFLPDNIKIQWQN